MKDGNRKYRSIALAENGRTVRVIDQRKLPWEVTFAQLNTLEDVATAISDMWVRGAPLIGATGAYGICFAMQKDASDASLQTAYDRLLKTRPTAINLKWALDSLRDVLLPLPPGQRVKAAYDHAAAICDEDAALCRAIGEHGLKLVKDIAAKKPGKPVSILTHCNTGWLATVDYGTALAVIYVAHESGVPVHVWVDETRPRNQGASLTAWELAQRNVPHTVITDNAGGLLMQQGKVDLCIVGADRVTRNGDVCNKIGTYLKALAAHDNNVPFYVALPYTTLDKTVETGRDVEIEERGQKEVTQISGRTASGKIETVTLTDSPAANPGFDITPARLVTAYITERGVMDKNSLISD